MAERLARIRLVGILLLGIPLASAWLAACTPKVQVEAPDKPITINLNVKIDHEVRVKVDRELDDAYRENPELF
jgi:YnbE-like lipoprotein